MNTGNCFLHVRYFLFKKRSDVFHLFCISFNFFSIKESIHCAFNFPFFIGTKCLFFFISKDTHTVIPVDGGFAIAPVVQQEAKVEPTATVATPQAIKATKQDVSDITENQKTGIWEESQLSKLKRVIGSFVTVKDITPEDYRQGKGSVYERAWALVDREERQILDYYTNECKDYIKKCKRNKQDVDIEHFKNEYQPDIHNQILSRLLDKSCEFNLYGIHTYMAEYYRIQLYNEMIRVGWTTTQALLWCFGWRKEYPKCEI